MATLYQMNTFLMGRGRALERESGPLARPPLSGGSDRPGPFWRSAVGGGLRHRAGFLEGEDVKVHCQVTEKRRQG